MAADPPRGAASAPVSTGAQGWGAAPDNPQAPTRVSARAPGRVPALERSQPAAASSALYDIVSGPFRPSRILGVSRLAVYLEVEGPRGATVIALLARDAVRLPNGLVLVGTQSMGPFADVASATSVRIGRCSAVLDGPTGPRSVHAGRWWRPPRPRDPRDWHRVAVAAAELQRRLLGAVGGLSDGAGDVLEVDLTAPGAADTACARLVGRGPGLTPSGDDILCGYLLAARHLGAPGAAAALADAAERWAPATTALSATLLRHAVVGQACPQAIALLDALSAGAPLATALQDLRSIGHTSGTDLALGLLAGAKAALRLCSDADTAFSTAHAGNRP